MSKQRRRVSAKRPRGRPSKYTTAIADEICARLPHESLRSICRDERMPALSTVLKWVVEDREGFSAQYARAVRARAALWADELAEIADNEGGDPNRDRLRVDTRKWLLAKMMPKQFGERLNIEGSVGLYRALDEIAADEAARLAALPDEQLRAELKRLAGGDAIE